MTIRYLQSIGPYQPGDIGGAGSVHTTEADLVEAGVAEWYEPDDEEGDVQTVTTEQPEPADKSDPEVREQLAEQALRQRVEDLPWQGEGDIRGLARKVQSEVGDDGPDGRAREDYEDYLLAHPDVTRELLED